MVSPLRSSCDDGSGGAASSMCWEPSRLVCPILAVAFFGSLTFLSKPSVRVATQFLSSMFLIVPTKTSATMTLLLPLIANVSGICTYTVYEPAPLPGPPGSSTCEIPRQPHELSTIAATSRTSPCQARCRIMRIIPFTGHLLAPQRAAVVRPEQVPAQAPKGALASVRRDRESPRVPAVAAVPAPGGPAPRCTAADRAPRCRHSDSPAGSAGPTEPAQCPARPSV